MACDGRRAEAISPRCFVVSWREFDETWKGLQSKMSNKKDVEREEKLINAARKGDLESVLVSLDLSFVAATVDVFVFDTAVTR